MIFYILFALLVTTANILSQDLAFRLYNETIGAWRSGGAFYGDGNSTARRTGKDVNAAADTAPPPSCTGSPVKPTIGSQAAWDAHFITPYGNTVPDLSNDGGDLAWTLYYWIRAYVSMAATYGDAKYLDRAVTSIDHMLAVENPRGGWGLAPLYDQLGTAQVTQAIMHFVYTVYKDPRFAAYRPKAEIYLARAERAVKMYDYRWVDHSPILDASFYIYASCGADGESLCGSDALLMFNQGASMAKALLLMDRVYRMKGQTPPAAYLYKADKAANYFLKFAQVVNDGYLWRYEGGRPGYGWEDTNHGHVDISFLVAARKFNVGGLTDADMRKLAVTLKSKIIDSRPEISDVAPDINGVSLSTNNYERVSVGYDWIDLADFDPAVLGNVVNVFNKHMLDFDVARGALGWAEILRKNSCTPLY